MNRFSKHKWWILTVLLTAPLVALAAVPNVFSPNTVISSASVNANFTNLDTRVAALEAHPTITTVWSNATGDTFQSNALIGSVTTGGGPITIQVSGTAFSASTPTLDLQLKFDGGSLGDLKVYASAANYHTTFPTQVFSTKTTPAAGSHNIELDLIAPTQANTGDYFNVTVTEY